MPPHRTILITGSTGTFGNYLLREFLSVPNLSLVLLVRADSDEAALKRLNEHMSLPATVKVLRCDLVHEDLGLEPHVIEELLQKVTHIVHAAASTRFVSHIDDLRLQNVLTTKNVLSFAKKCLNLSRFVHLSSAAVAGKRTGLILEDELEHTAGFNNAYEQSKYEAELLVRQDTIPWIVARPPLIHTVSLPTYRGPKNSLAHGLKMAERGYLPLFPGTASSNFDIVDGAEVASILMQLTLKESLLFKCYHITFGHRALKVGEILSELELKWKKKIRTEFCGGMDEFRRRVWWTTLLRPKMRVIYSKAQSYLSWFAYSKVFDNSHLLEEFKIPHLKTEPINVLRSILE